MVVHGYAFAETGIRVALAHVMGVSLIDVHILTEPLSSLQLRNVAKSIVKTHEPISPECERFLQLVGDLGCFSKLRNFVAHSRWRAGVRPEAIKPASLDVRDGKAKIIGMSDDEPDWTAQELWAEGNNLYRLCERISAFLVETGAAESMALNTSEGSNPTV